MRPALSKVEIRLKPQSPVAPLYPSMLLQNQRGFLSQIGQRESDPDGGGSRPAI